MSNFYPIIVHTKVAIDIVTNSSLSSYAETLRDDWFISLISYVLKLHVFTEFQFTGKEPS